MTAKVLNFTGTESVISSNQLCIDVMTNSQRYP